MPFQAPPWTEFYTCPICEKEFSTKQRLPISLGCGHTICRVCLATVYSRHCPFDQTSISTDVDNLPINNALLQLLNSGDDNADNDDDGDIHANNITNSEPNATTSTKSCKLSGIPAGGDMSDSECAAGDQHLPSSVRNLKPDDFKCYKCAKKCIEGLAQYLKSFVTNTGNSLLTRPMLRKLVTLLNCQLVEEEGRIRAVRTARFLGERTVTELLLQHQNPQQLSLCLWAAVRSRGCQFLGPPMQEEVLKLVLQALQNGSALSRKVLVMYVVQRLMDKTLPASKTSIGHVVQLLYRASCFKVSKREGDSSLMQLKDEFRNYEALRREHDAQIVQIATEAGLRIAPDQWSSLLYGNTTHKSHMQSICDTLQTPSSFAQSVQELVLALQRTGDPTNLSTLRPHLKHLASIDPSPESPPPTWQDVEKALEAVRQVVLGLVTFMQYQSNRKVQDYPMPPPNANGKYKISLCRDLIERRMCPRGTSCTFAHSAEERQRYRAKHRRPGACDKSIIRPHTSNSMVTSGVAIQLSDNMKKDYPGHQGSLVPPHQIQTQNHPNNHASVDGSSPVKLKPLSHRKYSNNDNSGGMNVIHPNVMESQFVADMSANTSPLHMQTPMNALHSSPIPPMGPLMGINAPGAIINVPPMQKQTAVHGFENMAHSYNAMNYGGKFVRMQNMGMPLPSNMRPLNVRGPMGNNGGGGCPLGQGILSPRSSVLNSANMTTVVNPPNLQGTNPNKSPGSPMHKNIFNNSAISGDFYNHCPPPPPFFANTNLDTATGDYQYRLTKHKFQKPHNPLWDMQHQQPPQQSSLQTDYSSNQRPHLFVPAPPHPKHLPNPETIGFFDNNNVIEFNKINQKPKLVDAPLHMPNEHMLYKEENNFLDNSGNISENSKLKGKLNIAPPTQDKASLFWNLNSNSPHMAKHLNHFGNNYMDMKGVSDVSLETAPPTLFFRDRESFVRSDSILDDDAATFDVTPTTSSFAGNIFGPICPMYKGLPSSMAASNNATPTNTFVDSWNPLISQGNDDKANCSGVSNNFAVFSLDNDNSLNMPIENHSPDSFNQPATSTSTAACAASSPTSNNHGYDSMQAALAKLSFITDSEEKQQRQRRNDMDYNFNPLCYMRQKDFHADIGKNDGLLWEGACGTNPDAATMSFGLNTFWSENTPTALANSTVSSMPTNGNNLITQSCRDRENRQQQQQHHHQQQQQQQHHQQQQQQQRTSQIQENELDITEIVENIWPCNDDSGIKLE